MPSYYIAEIDLRRKGVSQMKTKKRETPRGWFGDYPDWMAFDDEDFVTISPVYSEIKVKKAKVAKRRSQKARNKR